jgi:formate-dependent nitrite reductase membrane component NrfD
MNDSKQGYYGQPIVKPHEWKPWVPAYFWIGGTAGAATIGTVLARMRGMHDLARVYKRTALAGMIASPIFLILDLGVKHRFYKMLRVFKPTSPMSVGSWLLTMLGGTLAASTIAELLGIEWLSTAGEILAAPLAPAVASYTAVLISNTATPVWHEAYRELPFIFVASAVGGAGAVGVLFADENETGPSHRAMVLGDIGKLLGVKLMQQRLGQVLSEPYNKGPAGTMEKGAMLSGIAALALAIAGRKNQTLSKAAAALSLVSGMLERFTIMEAGKQSAQDPKYVIEQQRAAAQRQEPHVQPSTVTCSPAPAAMPR